MKLFKRLLGVLRGTTMKQLIMMLIQFVFLLGMLNVCIYIFANPVNKHLPMVINTWQFTNATEKAWGVVNSGSERALDAVEQGCSLCEAEQCDGTVGYGGSPDEDGETTLDAMIMDGTTHDVGAVGALRGIKDAIGVARRVLENTQHTLLVGSQATQFAVNLGFKKEDLSTESSRHKYDVWKKKDCQPNFWKNVTPDPKENCGPYVPQKLIVVGDKEESGNKINRFNHDTIGMIAINIKGEIAGGTSTNGAIHKIPGRVGDSPIPGSGCYVDRNVGGAAATGDGDVMMRLLPSLLAVESMRAGSSPSEAAEVALRRVVEYYPKFEGALVAAAIDGTYGAACFGLNGFHYSVANRGIGGVKVEEVECFIIS